MTLTDVLQILINPQHSIVPQIDLEAMRQANAANVLAHRRLTHVLDRVSKSDVLGLVDIEQTPEQEE